MRNATVRLRALLLLVVAFIYVDGGASFLSARRPPPICDDVCTGSTDCTETCYIDQMEFENGNEITCLEYGVYDNDFCCGDGLCNLNATETMNNCSDDCGAGITPPTCGQFGCEQGENCESCSLDCGSCDSAPSCNENGACDGGEGKDCEDCMATGFCTQDSDCPDFQGGGYKYACANDQCILEDLPTVSNTCSSDANCSWGWKCTRIPDNYHGSTFSCSPGSSPCNVCVPRWIAI